MILRKVIAGETEGDGPLYAIVQIEFGTSCTACHRPLEAGAPALFRFDPRERTRLVHPECR